MSNLEITCTVLFVACLLVAAVWLCIGFLEWREYRERARYERERKVWRR